MTIMDWAGVGEEVALWMLRALVFAIGGAVIVMVMMLAQWLAGWCH